MKVINLVVLFFISMIFADASKDSLDVAPVSIDIPSPIQENTILAPQATVINNGTKNESFDVVCMIYNPLGESLLYEVTEDVMDLIPSQSLQIVFSQDFKFVKGPYEVKVYTLLFGDMNPHNDTLVKWINITSGITENGITGEGFTFKAPGIVEGKANLEINLPSGSDVTLVVYDILGCQCQNIINQKLGAGSHNFSVNLNLPTGIYFYNLETEFGNKMQKFLMIK